MKVIRSTYRAAVVCLFLSCAVAEEPAISVQVVPSQIVNQRLHSANACGPASLMNALKFGDSELNQVYKKLSGSNDSNKLHFLIERHFRSRPSVVGKGLKRWGFQGVYVKDMAQSSNELLGELESSYLDREKGETDREQTLRIHEWMHDSIERGFPPILSLRSFIVRTRPENDMEPRWEMVFHHFVVVCSISALNGEQATGFEAKVVDSNGAKISNIHIHQESNGQLFNVLKGNDIEGEWISGRPFMLVTAPGINALRPVNLKWSERFLITANFLIGRF